METVLAVLLYFILPSISTGAENCGRTVSFSPELRSSGKRLLGHVIKSVAAPSEDACRITCFLENDCVSYTFGPSPDRSGICNISSSDHVTHPGDLLEKEGFVYQGIKNRCAGVTCPADTKCQSGFTQKGYRCWCNKTDGGYTGENCQQDIDECASKNICREDASCENTPGSYSCSCKMGFTGDGVTQCSDIDECTDSRSCHDNATCHNTVGSYSCTCNQGYTGNGVTCSDIDECAGNVNCHGNATCENSPGSYSCSCKIGYTGDGVTECSEIIPESVGCFKDAASRAIPVWLGYFAPPDGITKCLHQVLSRGYSHFGVQYGGECRSGPTANLTYDKYGPATNCLDGYGAGYANNVYTVPSG